MEIKCDKCGGTAWIANGDGEIYCPECELARAELYGEIAEDERKMSLLQ